MRHQARLAAVIFFRSEALGNRGGSLFVKMLVSFSRHLFGFSVLLNAVRGGRKSGYEFPPSIFRPSFPASQSQWFT